VNEGLTIKPLQSLCDDFKQDIVDGPFGSELQRKDYITEGVPVLKIQNVKPFAIELKRMDYVSPAKFQELRRHSYRRGDIIMTKLGSPLGVSAIVEDLDEGVIVADLVRIRAQQINTKYLCYHLNSQRTNDFINSMQKGTTRPRVTLSVVRELPIYVPPLPEQQRIVDILDKAFEGIATVKANAEKNLENARALFESHLQSVFTRRGKGWVEKRLGELARINYGYTESASAEKVGPHFLRITDIQDTGVDWDTVPYCPIDKSDLPKYKLADGDIVFARTGATTGKSYLVSNPPEAVFASYLIRVQLSDKELLPQFVNLFFQTHSYWDTIRAGVSGSAQGGFNATKLAELVIPFPKSSKEQVAVVAKLDKLTAETQNLAALYERKLAALEALKKSLQHQAFTGELTK
jgi:type I restriction enzyme S subunit